MFCRKVTLQVTSRAGSTCTLTLQSTALRTLVLLMGWISISRVRHLATTGGKETSQRRLKCFLNGEKASAAITWVEVLLCSGVLCQADGCEKKKRWNIFYIYGGGETSAGFGLNSPNRVSSLLREQLLTHTCLSNVYRSWWRDNTGLKTHINTHTLQP